VSDVIGSWSSEVLLIEDVDDGHTEMIKSFTGVGLACTNILIHDVCRETISENVNSSNTLLKSGQARSSYCIIPKVEVGIHILNCFDKP
jgi:hypothetical protein